MKESEGAVTPQIIPNVPIPMLGTSTENNNTVSPLGTQNSTEGAAVPSVIPNANIVPAPIASELIATSLDTQQRKILGQFSFGQVGAIQIGTYQHGVSGQINISPNGIVAKNSNGDTTFALDGDTGNAVFKGQIVAGSLISGNLSLGGAGNGDGLLQVYDNTGNIAAQADNNGFFVVGRRSFSLKDTSLTNLATIGIDIISGNTVLLFEPIDPILLPISLFIDMPAIFNNSVAFNGAVSSSGSISASGDIQGHNVFATNQLSCFTLFVDGVQKTAVVPTSEGYRALYCSESPEVWFFDFARDTYSIDPLFMEVTEGEMKIIHCQDGGIQIWRRRRGFRTIRFEEKTAEEFIRNNKFWSTPIV